MRVEPRLSAGAATGERTVFVAARKFGRNEARRLAVHEVFGHLLSAANGRAQPLRLMQWGTAGSFVDQEGVALYMEEVAGVLDGARLRTLAGRVIAADMMHAGATFADTARKLLRDEGFSPAGRDRDRRARVSRRRRRARCRVSARLAARYYVPCEGSKMLKRGTQKKKKKKKKKLMTMPLKRGFVVVLYFSYTLL